MSPGAAMRCHWPYGATSAGSGGLLAVPASLLFSLSCRLAAQAPLGALLLLTAATTAAAVPPLAMCRAGL